MRRSRRQFRDQLVDDEPNPSADAYFLFLRNLKLSLSGCSSLNELRLVFDKRMTALGLTSRDVSERAQVSKSTVNRILKGDAIPRLLTLCSLADALGVDLEIS